MGSWFLYSILALAAQPALAADPCTPSKMQELLNRYSIEERYAKELRGLEHSANFWQAVSGRPNSELRLRAQEKVLRTDVYLMAGEADLAILEWKDVFFDTENTYNEIRVLEAEINRLKTESPNNAGDIAAADAKRIELLKKFGKNFETYAEGRTFFDKVLDPKNEGCSQTCKTTALIVMEHTGAYDELRHSTQTQTLVAGERPAWNNEHRPPMEGTTPPRAATTAERAAAGTVEPMPKYADDDSIRAMFYRNPEAVKAAAQLEARLQKLNAIKKVISDPIFRKIAAARAKKIGLSDSALSQWNQVWNNLQVMETDIPEIVQISRSKATMAEKLVSLFAKATTHDSLLVTLSRTVEKKPFWAQLMAAAKEQDQNLGTDYEARLNAAAADGKKIGDLSMLTAHPFLQYTPGMAAGLIVAGGSYAMKSKAIQDEKTKVENWIDSVYVSAVNYTKSKI